MGTEKAWIIGSEGVITWYKDMAARDVPFYSVWSGRLLKFTYSGSDIEKGAEILETNLDMAEELGSSELLTIKLHPENIKGVVTDRTPYCASINFRCVEMENDRLYNKPQYMSGFKRMDDLQDELEKLKAERDEKPKGIMGYIEPMLENPQVQAAMGSMIMTAIARILPGVFGPMGTPAAAEPAGAAMGSIEDPAPGEMEDLQVSLERLEKKDPQIVSDLARLADLAEKNPALFEMLITQLRN